MWKSLFVKWSVGTKFYVLFVFPFVCMYFMLPDQDQQMCTFYPYPIRKYDYKMENFPQKYSCGLEEECLHMIVGLWIFAGFAPGNGSNIENMMTDIH